MTRMHFAHDGSWQPSLNVRRAPQTFNLHSKRIHSIRRSSFQPLHVGILRAFQSVFGFFWPLQATKRGSASE